MFQYKTALGGFADNRVKSIMTRNGHKIVFTEDESVIITDKSGNEIHLDTTGSNITITAPETMTLNCKNMNINVGENMTITLDIEVEELEALTSDATEVLFESSNSDLTITPDSLLLSSLISGGKILVFGGK
ncbi:hypothetical protein [Chryseobacterium sp. RLHN22]|uniref:hypothetical protein n=1 Tax=Chryseobacterium sp. RLHN22 TaxID=3437885 RepID=UPI003D9BE539